MGDLLNYSRRQWLAGAAMAATAGLAPRRAIAADPVDRTAGAKFKFSLAAYSYRQFLKGGQASMTLSDFVVACAEMGLEGTELTSYYFPDEVTPEYLRNLKAQCFRLGLDVSGTAVGNDFCHPPGEARQREIDSVKRWIDYAEILGAPVIRVFSGKPHGDQTAQEAHSLAVSALEECCAYAGDHGVFLALENHGGLTTTVEGLLQIVEDVQSHWFGVNVDSGNFHSEDTYGDLAKLAPFALNVQVKVVVRPAQGGTQPCDFARLATIFRESGYRGYIVLEYEEHEDPRVACPRFVNELRAAFG